jgi:hypothetical protein
MCQSGDVQSIFPGSPQRFWRDSLFALEYTLDVVPVSLLDQCVTELTQKLTETYILKGVQ